MAKKLYVGGLPSSVTSAELEGLFAQHGGVRSAEVVMDRGTGTSRGFGFVEMDSNEATAAAMKALDGHKLQSRTLTVNEAREPVRGGGGGGRSFGRRKRW
jgi:cold-inducible RNA-binding protein